MDNDTPAKRLGRQIDHLVEIAACLRIGRRDRALVLAAQHDVWNANLDGLSMVEPVTPSELATMDRWARINELHAYPVRGMVR